LKYLASDTNKQALIGHMRARQPMVSMAVKKILDRAA
jgi:hypothetical protein